MSTSNAPAKGPKYFIDIEDTEYPWAEPTITPEQIRELAGWSSDEPVVEVNLEDNTERTIQDGVAIGLKPGQGFAKKIRFKRG